MSLQNAKHQVADKFNAMPARTGTAVVVLQAQHLLAVAQRPSAHCSC